MRWCEILENLSDRGKALIPLVLLFLNSPGRILRFLRLTGVSSGLRRTTPAVLERPTTDDSPPAPLAADVLPTDRRGPLCLNLAIFLF